MRRDIRVEPRAFRMRSRVKLGVCLLLVAGTAWGLHACGLRVSDVNPERLRTFALSFGAWAPAVYLLAYGQPLVPLPASILTAAAGLAFGPWRGTLVAVSGATLRACTQFALARALGRDTVARLLKGRAAALDQRLGEHSFKAVLLIRLIPNFPYDVQNYTLSLSQVRFAPYALATLVGILPGTALFAFMGHAVTDPAHLWQLLLALLIIVGLMAWQRAWRKRRQSPA